MSTGVTAGVLSGDRATPVIRRTRPAVFVAFLADGEIEACSNHHASRAEALPKVDTFARGHWLSVSPSDSDDDYPLGATATDVAGTLGSITDRLRGPLMSENDGAGTPQ